eukprot:1196209-Prorocentrum_minimum.AAC.4
MRTGQIQAARKLTVLHNRPDKVSLRCGPVRAGRVHIVARASHQPIRPVQTLLGGIPPCAQATDRRTRPVPELLAA